MQAFKKILVPIDFSPHSSFAVRQGADLARRWSAALVLLHVLDPLPYALPAYGEVFSPEQRAQLAVEIQRSLAALRLRAQTAGAPSVESAVREGHPPLEIVRFAEAGGFDLIVMGTHGRRGLAHAVLGSVVERVMRAAPCPVLTVRAPQERLTPEEEVWASG